MTVKIVAGVAYGFAHMFGRECFAFGIVDFSKSPSVLDLIISWVAECANLVTTYSSRYVRREEGQGIGIAIVGNQIPIY